VGERDGAEEQGIKKVSTKRQEDGATVGTKSRVKRLFHGRSSFAP